MRLTIKTLSYRNFLSSGAADITIDFTLNPTLLITGGNGAGKSTVLDALCFGLFGKPFRNVTKATVVNSVNNRDCVIEIEFDIGTDAYRVVRGIKPNIFDIYKNGLKIDALPDMRDQQSYLEDDILRLNRKAFLQVVILGKAGYIPFMLLTAAQRREVVEELLDIGIFSRMAEKAKSLQAQVQADLQRAVDKVDSFAPMNDLLLEQLESAGRDHRTQILRMQNDITRMNAEIAAMVPPKYSEAEHKTCLRMIEDHTIEIEQMNKTIGDLIIDHSNTTKELQRVESMYDSKLAMKQVELKAEIETAERAVQSNDDKIAQIESNRDSEIRHLIAEKQGMQREAALLNQQRSVCDLTIEKAEKDSVCPTCGQDIIIDQKHIDHVANLKKKMADEKKSLLVKIKKLDAEMANIDARVDEIKKTSNASRAELVKQSPDLFQALQKLRDTQASRMAAIRDEKKAAIEAHANGPCKATETALNDAKAELFGLKKLRDQAQAKIAEFERAKERLGTFESDRKMKESRVADLATTLATMPEETDMMQSIKVKIAETKTKTEKAHKKVDEIRDFLSVVQVATKLLKDDGIKAAVVSRYLPTLNDLINAYLQKLGLMVSFEFSPTFEESIRSRYLDDFRYENFSEGEKMRIELALLFAWRKIAKLKSSLDCNLVFFDEVFDASLDAEGCDQFLSIVNEMDTDGTHAIMISHKENDQFIDKFSRHIHFEKVDGFSAYHEISR